MIKEFFEKNYKVLMVFPFLLLITSLVFLGYEYSTTGDIVERDVSLKGGISATVYTEKEFEVIKLESDLTKELNSDVFVKELSDFSTSTRLGYVIEIGEIGVKDMLKAVIFAFVLMGIVVFIAFRSFIPSAAVILSALLDISATLMIVNLLEIKISTAGIAAFLLVIGYSVDTDILMTNRVLKRKEGGDTTERLIDSAKTGLTMSATTFVALTVCYIVTTSFVLKQMFLIILIALTIDIISTYLMNAGILYWYKKQK